MLALVLAAGGGAVLADAPAALPAARTALLLLIDGPIGPPTADYIERGLAQARERQAKALILQIDTPGGLDSSMRQIIRAILASPVPVLAYVAPGGARAASAGTYILYASHVAAMAPGTNLGAATPVNIAMPSGDETGRTPKATPDAQHTPASGATDGIAHTGSAMESKSINDAAAYIRSLAALHGRNASWAERAVREAVSLSAKEARDQGVIDLIAESVPDLLGQSNGRKVKVAAGEGMPVQATITLDTADLTVERIEPGLRTRALSVLANPNVALLLMTVGLYGLLFEFMTPGAIYPGLLGAICLLLGLYSLSALPLSYAGLAMLVLGLGMLIAEAFMPSMGMLGIGGALAFAAGAVMLIDSDAPAYSISLPFAAGVAVAAFGFALLIARLALSSRMQPRHTGAQAMVGGLAVVQDWTDAKGHVFFAGERWNAHAHEPLRAGQQVRIVAVEGLELLVSPHPTPT